MDPGVIVVMGVSGSGKTTVAMELARRLGWRFAEGDTFHPQANVAKMRAGIALTDEDRWPWLDVIATWIRDTRETGDRCVVACSALRRAYRKRLAAGRDDVCFVYLQGGYELVASRLSRREGHYMPLSLLRSQYETLEEPQTEENPIVVPIERPPEELTVRIIEALRLSG